MSRAKVEPEDGPGLERLARDILRPPLSQERMRWAGWTRGGRLHAQT